MTILDQLHREHDEVTEIFKTLGSTTVRAVKTRKELFEKLKNDLMLHTAAEEKILYDQLMKTNDGRGKVKESLEEHKLVRLLFEQICELSPDDEQWLPKLMVLRENIEHHVEEEEGRLFLLARKCFSEEQLEEMKDDFLIHKEKVTDGERGSMDAGYHAPSPALY